VDEIYLGKSREFLTVVSNLETGEPLWFAGNGRKRRSTTSFGANRAPDCRIVYDKFHVMRHAGRAVDEAAGGVLPQGRMRGVVKRQALAAADQMDESGWPKAQLLNELFRINRRVMKAYLLKESPDRLWTYTYEDAALRYLNGWIDQLRHLEGILNYCRVKVPFGFVATMHCLVNRCVNVAVLQLPQ
jgi:hypothetical protein